MFQEKRKKDLDYYGLLSIYLFKALIGVGMIGISFVIMNNGSVGMISAGVGCLLISLFMISDSVRSIKKL